MTYTELVAAAAVGTSHRPLPSLPEGLLPEPLAEQTRAEQLLDAAAAYAVVRRATLPVISGLAAPPPAPDELPPVPSEKFVAGLSRLLAQLTDEPRQLPVSTLTVLVAEALGWVGEAGWRVPERMLVPILARAAQDPGLGEVAFATIGERGRWLAALNPAWASEPLDAGTESLDEQAWLEGDPPTRLRYFTSLRSRDPGAARAVLTECWSSEAVDDRITFVSVIAEKPTEADEPFLVAAMKDRSKRVAEAARPGLLRIRNSALLGRLRELAKLAVSVRGGPLNPTVDLTPPNDDAATKADLSVTATYSRTPAEQRLNVLIASIPPAEWPALVGVPASDLVPAKADQPWSVVRGLADAALFWNDEQLTDSLVSAGITFPWLVRRLGPAMTARWLDDPAKSINAVIIQQLVETWPRPWPAPLSQALGGWIQRQVAAGKQAAKEIPADILIEAAVGVPVVVARGWAARLRELALDDRVLVRTQRAAHLAAGALTLRAAMYDDVRAGRDPVPTVEPTYLQEDR